MKTVIGCRPIYSSLMALRLRANPFNVTTMQVSAPTPSYDDNVVEEFYAEVHSLVNQTPKRDILVVQGDWNAKVGEDACEDSGAVCRPSCNPVTHGRGVKLLDFASYNNLELANTLYYHKPSRRWTRYSLDGVHHYQIDYIMVKNEWLCSGFSQWYHW